MKRGRPSAASMELATVSPIEIVARQVAPHDLNDEECEVWSAVVNSEPADWFTPSTVPLLRQYCRHVIQARRVAELIEKATCDPDLAFKDYAKLLETQRMESAIIATLAVKMRIAQQSTTNHRGNKKPSATKKPWES